jgi:hypothetical protein
MARLGCRDNGHGHPATYRTTPVSAGGRWRLVGLLVANGFAQAAVTVVASLLVERAFVRLASTASKVGLRTMLDATAAFAAAAGTGAWLRGRERFDAERLGQGYVHELRVQLFERLTHMSPWAVGATAESGRDRPTLRR